LIIYHTTLGDETNMDVSDPRAMSHLSRIGRASHAGDAGDARPGAGRARDGFKS
jgi:hypothetical protein